MRFSVVFRVDVEEEQKHIVSTVISVNFNSWGGGRGCRGLEPRFHVHMIYRTVTMPEIAGKLI